MKKYYSKYQKWMLQNIKIFLCCSSYKQLLLQNISAFNIVSGESFNILLTNYSVSFEQLDPGLKYTCVKRSCPYGRCKTFGSETFRCKTIRNVRDRNAYVQNVHIRNMKLWIDHVRDIHEQTFGYKTSLCETCWSKMYGFEMSGPKGPCAERLCPKCPCAKRTGLKYSVAIGSGAKRPGRNIRVRNVLCEKSMCVTYVFEIYPDPKCPGIGRPVAKRPSSKHRCTNCLVTKRLGMKRP